MTKEQSSGLRVVEMESHNAAKHVTSDLPTFKVVQQSAVNKNYFKSNGKIHEIVFYVLRNQIEQTIQFSGNVELFK